MLPLRITARNEARGRFQAEGTEAFELKGAFWSIVLPFKDGSSQEIVRPRGVRRPYSPQRTRGCCFIKLQKQRYLPSITWDKLYACPRSYEMVQVSPSSPSLGAQDQRELPAESPSFTRSREKRQMRQRQIGQEFFRRHVLHGYTYEPGNAWHSAVSQK